MTTLDHATPAQAQSDRVLFVARLDPRTTGADLVPLFAPFDPAVAIRVVDEPGTRRSRGFAYVSFAAPHLAAAALQYLNAGPGPYGCPLAVQFADAEPALVTRTNKLVVRNVASGVTGSLLRDAFAVHGTVTGVRLQQDRGAPQPLMAHVTFATADAAHAAQERTNGRLVLPGTSPVLDVHFADVASDSHRVSVARPFGGAAPLLGRSESIDPAPYVTSSAVQWHPPPIAPNMPRTAIDALWSGHANPSSVFSPTPRYAALTPSPMYLPGVYPSPGSVPHALPLSVPPLHPFVGPPPMETPDSAAVPGSRRVN
jgi:hypothetical protein